MLDVKKQEIKIGARIIGKKELEILMPNYDDIFSGIEFIRSVAECYRQRKKDSKDILKHENEFSKHFNNTFSLLGDRGSGKTAVMLTIKYLLMTGLYNQMSFIRDIPSDIKKIDELREYLKKNGKSDYALELDDIIFSKLFSDNDSSQTPSALVLSSPKPDKSSKDIFLPIIVPNDMDKSSDILGWIVAYLFTIIQDIEKDLKNHHFKVDDKEQKEYFDELNRLVINNPLRSAYKNVKKYYEMRKESYKTIVYNNFTGENDYLNDIDDVLSADRKLISHFQKLWEEILKIKKYMTKEEPLIYAFFDDIDIDIGRCKEILNIIMRYLSHSNIVVFITFNEATLNEGLTIEFLRKDGLLPSNLDLNEKFYNEKIEQSILSKYTKFTQDYLSKVIPPALRYNMHGLSSKRKANFVYTTESEYSKDNSKSEDKDSGPTDESKKDATVVLNLYQLLVINFIGDFYNQNEVFPPSYVKSKDCNFLHFRDEPLYSIFKIFPDNFRGLLNVYYFLYEDIDKINNETRKKRWNKERTRQFLNILVSSSPVFSKYQKEITQIIGIKGNGNEISIKPGIFVDYPFLLKLFNEAMSKTNEKNKIEIIEEFTKLYLLAYFFENIYRVTLGDRYNCHGTNEFLQIINSINENITVFPNLGNMSDILLFYGMVNFREAYYIELKADNYYLQKYVNDIFKFCEKIKSKEIDKIISNPAASESFDALYHHFRGNENILTVSSESDSKSRFELFTRFKHFLTFTDDHDKKWNFEFSNVIMEYGSIFNPPITQTIEDVNKKIEKLFFKYNEDKDLKYIVNEVSINYLESFKDNSMENRILQRIRGFCNMYKEHKQVDALDLVKINNSIVDLYKTSQQIKNLNSEIARFGNIKKSQTLQEKEPVITFNNKQIVRNFLDDIEENLFQHSKIIDANINIWHRMENEKMIEYHSYRNTSINNTEAVSEGKTIFDPNIYKNEVDKYNLLKNYSINGMGSLKLTELSESSNQAGFCKEFFNWIEENKVLKEIKTELLSMLWKIGLQNDEKRLLLGFDMNDKKARLDRLDKEFKRNRDEINQRLEEWLIWKNKISEPFTDIIRELGKNIISCNFIKWFELINENNNLMEDSLDNVKVLQDEPKLYKIINHIENIFLTLGDLNRIAEMKELKDYEFHEVKKHLNIIKNNDSRLVYETVKLAERLEKSRKVTGSELQNFINNVNDIIIIIEAENPKNLSVRIENIKNSLNELKRILHKSPFDDSATWLDAEGLFEQIKYILPIYIEIRTLLGIRKKQEHFWNMQIAFLALYDYNKDLNISYLSPPESLKVH